MTALVNLEPDARMRRASLPGEMRNRVVTIPRRDGLTARETGGGGAAHSGVRRMPENLEGGVPQFGRCDTIGWL